MSSWIKDGPVAYLPREMGEVAAVSSGQNPLRAKANLLCSLPLQSVAFQMASLNADTMLRSPSQCIIAQAWVRNDV